MSDCPGISCCNEVFSVKPPNPPPPPIVYTNSRQCATVTCPTGLDGDPVTECVDAGLYTSTVSQQDADNQAYQAALAAANANLNCGLAGALEGLTWLLPGLDPPPDNPTLCAFSVTTSVAAQGTVGKTYRVQLRIRGVVELAPFPHWQTLGGAAGTASGNVFTFTNTSQAIPVSSFGSGANQYFLKISNPAKVVALNCNPANVDPTDTTAIDFQITVDITTGATVSLQAYSTDSHEWSNSAHNYMATDDDIRHPIQVAQPYFGQFMQMDVLSIVPLP